jgi:Zn finger protein HypA/HybF involved in hydrogenase expression
MHSSDEMLQCADCGQKGDASSIARHSGAVSEQGNEGRIRRTSVALCPKCAAKRLEVQDAALI